MSYTYKQPRRTAMRYDKKPKPSSRLLGFLCYAIPFLLINGCIFYLVTAKPKIEVTVGDSNDYITSPVTIKIKSLLPTKGIVASMDSQELELEKTGRKEYVATVQKNGVLEITVTNFNTMFATDFEQISSLDDNPPTINSDSIESGILTIVMEDSQSGIDYDSLFATGSTGASQKPLTIDKTTSTATFKMDPLGLTVTVKDMAGHQVQSTYTSPVEVESNENSKTESSKNSGSKTSSKSTSTKSSSKSTTNITIVDTKKS